MEAEGPHRPDYPPKTPPPPKRPVQVPVPEPKTVAALPLPIPDTSRIAARPRLRMTMRNRQIHTFTLTADRWAAGKVGARVIEALRGWGYRPDADAVNEVSRLLVGAAVADEGRRISVHVADQDAMALVVVLSHRPGPAPEHDVLARIASVNGTLSCGTDAAPEGRRVWALMDTVAA